jgi:ribosome-associated protein
MGDMRIRPGTTADQASALTVFRLAQTARDRTPAAERLTRVAEKLATELLVVADDDAIVGFAVGEPERLESGTGEVVPTALHLSMLFVQPDHQRQGVGSALLEGLADAAWGQGYRTLSTWSATPEFYQACGLEPTGETLSLPDGRTAARLRAELEAPSRVIELDGTGIRLGQLLKFAGLVDTGAEAKSLLVTEGVAVNGEVETRRGRQLRDGDEVRTDTDSVTVSLRPVG